MDIIVFDGQSNMQGQSEALTSTEVIPNAFEYRYLDNQIIPLKNPVEKILLLIKRRAIDTSRASTKMSG